MTPRVLVVDDNLANLRLATYLLGAAGSFEVSQAMSAEEARTRVYELRPHLVLMDVQMPEVDGLTLTRALRNDASLSAMRIVAFTAYAMKGDEQRLRGAGFDGYIAKPIVVSEFVATVKGYLVTQGP
jgi:CheY-like chemotaxis protein